MHVFSVVVAVLVSVAIIGIGVMYLVQPRSMMRSFGLPLPEDGPNTGWWLRLKGSRDIVSGIVVLIILAWGDSRLLGFVLLAEALIPISDMGVILAAKGSTRTAVGVHGVTAALMIAAAVPLI